MSKINQIQKALLELDGGEFQKLADAYLHKRGYDHINPLGSVVGRNKTHAGTPDSYMPKTNGKFVFAEYTTQQDGLFDKMMGDLKKCFDEEKTGLTVDKIEEVVFCNTSTLEPDQENALRMECQKRGVNLNIFGIGPVSYDLYQLYPGLARDFLDIEVDTGQIVSVDEFVTAYNKSSLATPLDTVFHFREDELSRLLSAIESNSLVVVSGRAGVGKSRLALEGCRRFAESHPEFVVRCILNRGIPDLYQDLRVHFAKPGSYLIFVDDANRVSGFGYVIQLLNEQDEKKQFRIVVTVRDYAIAKIREASEKVGGGKELDIEKLKDGDIRKLITDECGIQNYHYLDRIVQISSGNPRLAIMAGRLAKQENTLQSISDVSSLYDQYYGSIRKDIEALNSPILLQSAGIVSFFRSINFSDQELLRDIQKAFGVSSTTLLEATKRLHDMEIVDMYQNAVVKFSDQVLSTYFFYLTFFKEDTLSLSTLLDHFFPRFQHKIIDSINPVMNAFNFEAAVRTLRPHIDRKWDSLDAMRDEEGLLHLMEAFWYIKETDTLAFVQDKISKIESELTNVAKTIEKADSNIPALSILNILRRFCYSDEGPFQIALKLLCQYLAKRPSEAGYVLYLLQEDFGFKHTSYLSGFTVQCIVIETLWEYTKNGADSLFSKLFLEVSKRFLQMEFHTTESKGGREFTILTFQLPHTDALIELRRKIWDEVFTLYKLSEQQSLVLSLLEDYVRYSNRDSGKTIMKKDAEKIVPFIRSELDHNDFRHCTLVQDYLDMLESSEISTDGDIRDRFKNETYAVFEILCDDWNEKRNRDLSYDQYRQVKQERIERYFANYTYADYGHFFSICANTYTKLRDEHNEVSD